jgi:hypothetical protein
MLLLNPPLMSFFQQMINLDHQLFKLINVDGTSSLLDLVLPFLREAQFWLPFYLFLLVFATLNFGIKGWWWALAFISRQQSAIWSAASSSRKLFFDLGLVAT